MCPITYTRSPQAECERCSRGAVRCSRVLYSPSNEPAPQPNPRACRGVSKHPRAARHRPTADARAMTTDLTLETNHSRGHPPFFERGLARWPDIRAPDDAPLPERAGCRGPNADPMRMTPTPAAAWCSWLRSLLRPRLGPLEVPDGPRDATPPDPADSRHEHREAATTRMTNDLKFLALPV